MKKITIHIERYFWLFLIVGIVLGLSFPFDKLTSTKLIKPLLMLLMFAVFLKSDIAEVLKRMRNFRQMAFFVFMYMLVIPTVFFFIIFFFNHQLAVAALLLVAMPTAMAAPVITDILKGNKELAASMSVFTSIVAPFTIPLLFWLLGDKVVNINLLAMLKDVFIFIFLPLFSSLLFKRFFRNTIEHYKWLISPFNILLLSVVVYFVMSAHRNVFFDETILGLFEKLLYVYLIFIALYAVGYLMGFKEDNTGKIATAVNAAYMNNGMAIVIAAIYFSPYVLAIAVLSELPWNTLPGIFNKVNKSLNRVILD